MKHVIGTIIAFAKSTFKSDDDIPEVDSTMQLQLQVIKARKKYLTFSETSDLGAFVKGQKEAYALRPQSDTHFGSSAYYTEEQQTADREAILDYEF